MKKELSRQRKNQLKNIENGLCALGKSHGAIYKCDLCVSCYNKKYNKKAACSLKNDHLNAYKLKKRKEKRKENVKLGFCYYGDSHGKIYKCNLCLNCYEKYQNRKKGKKHDINLNVREYRCSKCREFGHIRTKCNKRDDQLEQNVIVNLTDNSKKLDDFVILNSDEEA